MVRTLLSSTSGEKGGWSESEPPPFRGPLLWERRPEVSGKTSCCTAKQDIQTISRWDSAAPSKQKVVVIIPRVQGNHGIRSGEIQ